MRVEVIRLHGSRFEVRAREVSTVVDRPETGDGFRPVELLLGSLGSCMLGTMLTFAENQGIPVDDVTVALTPVIAEHPERVAQIEMVMRIHGDFSERQLLSLRRVAERCKIHNTLHGSVETTLSVEVVAADPSARDLTRSRRQ